MYMFAMGVIFTNKFLNIFRLMRFSVYFEIKSNIKGLFYVEIIILIIVARLWGFRDIW